ncbi:MULTISPECIES: hypothetical protein [Streptomyces]|uniref:hypothetical protein n=1 Tax=Streptomyces TaxID=1883 RepID=UPI00031E10FA|nr:MULTISPECIES: hypothetical protein [Streptomyces]
MCASFRIFPHHAAKASAGESRAEARTRSPGGAARIYNWDGDDWDTLWAEAGAPASSASVGAGNNDKADGIKAC